LIPISYDDKYKSQSASYSAKYTDPGNKYDEKYNASSDTQYVRKYPPTVKELH
jgi:hypothetical protein